MRDNNKGVFFISVMIMMLMGGVAASCDIVSAASKARTYYTNRDMYGVHVIVQTRCRVNSYYLGKTTSYTKKKEVGVVKNTTKKPVTRSISLTRSTKRSFSMSLTAALPKEVVKSDIKATIGGSISYDTSMTVSASGQVPPKSSRSVYLQYKTVSARYKYVVQKQCLEKGKWKNIEKPYTRYNVSTTKVPVLVF